MRVLAVTRNASLCALAALTLLVGAMSVATPKASASLSQCPANAVCVWEGRNYDGNFSWWPAWDTGCHNHAFNPNLRSIWNNSNVWWVGFGSVAIGGNVQYSLPSGSVTTPICWPV